MRLMRALLICGAFAWLLTSCGGSGGGTGGGPDQSAPATITFTFVDNAPLTAALQVGGGAFVPVNPQNKQLVLNIPAGVSRYILAYDCAVSGDFVVEATKQDGTAFNASCVGLAPSGLLTGTVDASQIAGATSVDVDGKQGLALTVGAIATFTNASMPAGSNDVAVVAFSTSGAITPKAVRIFRSQIVPGALNGGNPVVLGAGDLLTQQPITLNNVPAGFAASTTVEYHTANGVIPLLDALTQYPTIPSATAQPGDFYLLISSATNSQINHASSASFIQRSPGGPITANLPPVWSFSGPVPSALPNFPINYSGFGTSAGTFNQVHVSWVPALRTTASLEILTTGNFASGTGVVVPDLRSLPNFPAPPASGIDVNWTAQILNTPLANVVISAQPWPSGNFSMVTNLDSFTVP